MKLRALGTPLGCLAVVLLVALGAGLGIYYAVLHLAHDTVQAVADPLAGAFRLNVDVHTTISTTITSVDREPKLVVLSPTFDVQVTKSQEARTLWGKLYLGTTTVQVLAHGNQGQYVVPLSSLSASDFRYDAGHQTLVVQVPNPVFDEQMVSVQSDARKIEIMTDVGWASLDRYEGQFLRDEAIRELRPAVIAQGKSDVFGPAARENARKVLKEKLYGPLADKLRPDVRLEIEFK